MLPPMHLTLASHPTPVGDLLLAHDADGALRVLDFDDHRPRMLRLLHRQYGRNVTVADGPAPALTTTALDAYFAGDHAALDAIPVATAGTAFQRAVWAALRAIPPGATESYGALARRVGNPAAVRAVGLANGANPVGIVVPCHRVIGADGTLTGYGGGVERKRWLLQHEGVTLRL